MFNLIVDAGNTNEKIVSDAFAISVSNDKVIMQNGIRNIIQNLTLRPIYSYIYSIHITERPLLNHMVTYNRLCVLMLTLNKPYNAAFYTLIVNFDYNSLQFEDGSFNKHTSYSQTPTVY